MIKTKWTLSIMFLAAAGSGADSLDEKSRFEESSTQAVAGHEIHIQRYADGHSQLKITQNGRPVYSAKSGGKFYVGPLRQGLELNQVPIGFHPNPGSDITGLGRPNLVISEWSGGAHCCYFFHIFELAPKFRHIETIEGGDFEPRFEDTGKSGAPIVVLNDGFLVYEFTAFGFSPAPEVKLRFSNGRYRVAVDLMKRPPPSAAEMDALMSEHQIILETKGKASPEFWKSLLGKMNNLIFSGNEEKALEFLERAWPSDDPDGKLKFLKKYRQLLNGDRYYRELIAAKPATE